MAEQYQETADRSQDDEPALVHPQDQETAPGLQEAQDRLQDVELLGNSYKVRQMVGNLGNKRTRTWESIAAKTKNGFDLPGKKVLEFRHSRAERKHDEAKEAHQSLIDEHEGAKRDLMESDMSDRLKQRRLNRLEKKQQKQVKKSQAYLSKWENKRSIHKTRLEKHTATMQARRESVSNHYEQRRAEMTKKLLERKVMAEGRKTLRAQLRAEGASSRPWNNEVRSIVGEIPDHQRKRVGEIAIRAQLSNDASLRARFSAESALRSAEQAKISLEKNMADAMMHGSQAAAADKVARDIEQHALPSAQDRLVSLQKQYDSLDENDPSRIIVMADIRNAEAEIHDLTRKTHLERTKAENHRKQNLELLGQEHGLLHEIVSRQVQAEQQTAAHNQHRGQSDQLSAQQREEVQHVLNSDERK